ncbi:hypothetical protein [Pseudomonas leptonychotis]|uniref:hypothetical protein n=1 Tax=Pseudomonas leptonychotis TaxID=2448482 RepID=UPI0038681852
MNISNSLTALKSAMATIDKRVEELKAALSAVHQEAAELRTAKAALLDAPLRLSDFSHYLMDSIQQQGEGVATAWARERFAPHRGQSYAKRPWSEFERGNGTPVSGQMVSSVKGDASDLGMLCFLIPEVIYGKLMERLQAVVGEDKWGNMEHPTIEVRREQIAKIDARLEELSQRAAELNTEIGEITSAFSR